MTRVDARASMLALREVVTARALLVAERVLYPCLLEGVVNTQRQMRVRVRARVTFQVALISRSHHKNATQGPLPIILSLAVVLARKHHLMCYGGMQYYHPIDHTCCTDCLDINIAAGDVFYVSTTSSRLKYPCSALVELPG